MEKNVFVIIIASNNLPELQTMLPSLLAQRKIGITFVLVDDGSTDKTQEYVKSQFPTILYIANKANLGYVKSANIGIEFAMANRATHVMLVSPSVNLPENGIDLLVQRGGDIVSPIFIHTIKNIPWYETGGTVAKPLFKPKFVLVKTKPPGSFNIVPQFISFRCVLFDAKVLRKVGKLPQTYQQYFADISYCIEAKKAGFRITMQPKCHAHVVRRSPGTHISKMARRYFYADYSRLVTDYAPKTSKLLSKTSLTLNRVFGIFSARQARDIGFDPLS